MRFTSAGVIEPRRGFVDFESFGNANSLGNSMAFYGENILLQYDDNTIVQWTPDVPTFTAIGSGVAAPVGTNRLRMEGAARSMFFNTAAGIFSFDGTTYGAAPPATPLNIRGFLYPSATGAAGGDGRWFDGSTAVAYRYTVCKKDAFGRILESAPSGRVTVVNSITSTVGVSLVNRTGGALVHVVTDTPHGLITGETVTLTPGEANFAAGSFVVTVVDTTHFTYAQAGANVSGTVTETWNLTRSVQVRINFPTVGWNICDTNSFFRVYRSLMTATATDTPSDELWLIEETPYMAAADIAAGFFDFVDVTPDDVIGPGVGAVPLYTNANQNGILQANNPPPLAGDIVYWANRMWYANTRQLSSATITILGTGAPDGIQAGDTFTIFLNFGSTVKTYTAGADFAVYTTNDPGYNIQQTALSLVDAINSNAAGYLVYAYYTSSEGGLPGVIYLQEIYFGSAALTDGFKLYGSRAESWTPQLPTYVAPPWPAPASTNDTHAGRVVYSRLGLPEATPLLNFVEINSDNDEILRIFPLHYRLLIFKTDGIYTCTNVDPFQVQKLSAYKLLAPDSLCILEDRVYALTDQGIITISDAGEVQISNCIDDVFNAMLGTDNISTLAARTFGLAYRSERQVLLWTPELDDSGVVGDDNEQAYVYSTLANGFTRYGFGVRCAAINPADNSLYYVATDENEMRREVKNLNAFDYQDDVIPVTISSVSGETVTLTASVGAQAGDVLSQTPTGASFTTRCLITAVNGAILTVDGTPGFSASSANIYVAIETDLEFNKLTGATPADLKSVGRVSLLFRRNDMSTTTANFASETQTIVEPVALENIGWGDFPWGEVPYGNPTQQIRRVEPIPPDIQQCAQLSVGFSTRQALAKFDFLGIDVVEREDTKTAGR